MEPKSIITNSIISLVTLHPCDDVISISAKVVLLFSRVIREISYYSYLFILWLAWGLRMFFYLIGLFLLFGLYSLINYMLEGINYIIDGLNFIISPVANAGLIAVNGIIKGINAVIIGINKMCTFFEKFFPMIGDKMIEGLTDMFEKIKKFFTDFKIG